MWPHHRDGISHGNPYARICDQLQVISPIPAAHQGLPGYLQTGVMLPPLLVPYTGAASLKKNTNMVRGRLNLHCIAYKARSWQIKIFVDTSCSSLTYIEYHEQEFPVVLPADSLAAAACQPIC